MGRTVTAYATSRTDLTGAPTLLASKSEINTSRSAVVKTTQHALRKTRPNIFIPPTPFTASMTNDVSANVYFRTASSGQLGWDHGKYGGVTAIPVQDAAILDKLQNRAVIACLEDLKGMKLNLAQAFAERRQTANLVADSARKIARALRAARKGDMSGAAKALGVDRRSKKRTSQNMADRWLELQYGWKPLLGDVYNSMVVLNENDKAEPQRYRVTVKKQRHETTKGKHLQGGTGIRYRGFLTRTHSVFVRLDYSMKNPLAAASNDFGIDNPALLAWELLPWSFVADWFVPVGSYLGTIGATAGYDFVGGSATRHYDASFAGEWFRDGYNFSSWKLPFWGGYGAEGRRKNVQRTVYTTSPVPRLPGFKNPLSLMHLANALALLRGSVR